MSKAEYSKLITYLAKSDPFVALYSAMYHVKQGEEMEWMKHMPNSVALAYVKCADVYHDPAEDE